MKTCIICEKETCDDYDECRIEWLAQCKQDHLDFVSDMEESEIARLMSQGHLIEYEVVNVVKGHVMEEPSFPKVQLKRRNK